MPILILQYCFNNLVKLYIQIIQISPAFIVLLYLGFCYLHLGCGIIFFLVNFNFHMNLCIV